MAGMRTAAEVELYGASVSPEVLRGEHLPPPRRTRFDDDGPKRALEYIGEVIARTSPSGMADVIVLASQSSDDARQVGAVIRRDILKLTRPLHRQGIDVRFSPVDPKGAQWTKDPHRVGEMLDYASELPAFTALIQALRIVSDRGADLHCLFVTNSRRFA